MSELKWFYPESLDAVQKLLDNEGVVPHGGGTGLLLGNVRKYKGLIDLRFLPLANVRENGDSVEIGATVSYAKAARELEKILPGNIITKSLSAAASTPLRNRITIGGSLIMAPIWSDLIGPLVALEATVSLIGRNKGRYPVEEFLANPKFRAKSLLTGVEFPKESWETLHYRAVRTAFDYPMFTLTILAKRNAAAFDDIRIVFTGNSGKFKRLREIENDMRGKNTREIDIKEMVGKLKIKFPPKRQATSEYVGHLGRIQLERALETISKGEK